METAAVLCLVYGKFIEVCKIHPSLSAVQTLLFVGMEAKRSCFAEQSTHSTFVGELCP